jgi:WD40 repeat protein
MDFAYEIPEDVPEHQYRSHLGGVYHVRVHPDRSRKTFASCSVDNSVKVWHVNNTTPQRTLEDHFNYVLDVAWAGGDVLASASFDGSVRVWNAATGECLHLLDDHEDSVTSLSLTRDNKYLASASNDGSVRLWSMHSGDLINQHEGPGR